MEKQLDPQGPVTQRDLNEEISKLAYDFYKKRGMTDGHHYDDWVKAERIVMEQYARTKKDFDLMSEAAGKKASRRATVKRARSS